MNTGKNNLIFFSILIPTYNQEEYLPVALDSVLRQTYPNWEAIIVDDGSTDGTYSVMEKYAKQDSRFKIYSKENGGTGSALNEGLKHVKGDWICWLSSDDLFDDKKLEVHKKAIEENSKIKFFYSHYYVLDGEKNEIYAPDFSSQTGFYIAPYQVLGFFNGNYINGLSIAIHRSVFYEVGAFNEKYRYAQDYDMWLRIVAKFKARYIDYRTIVTRIYPSQITTAHPEWGILDSARAAIDFINTHRFEEYFPWLSLDSYDNIKYAIEQSIYLSLDKEIFLYKGNFSTAFLERLREWLYYGCPEKYKNFADSLIENILSQIEEFNLSSQLPHNISEALNNLRNATRAKFEYIPHNFINEIIHANTQGENKEKIKLYISKIKRDSVSQKELDNLLPKVNFVKRDLKGKPADISSLHLAITKANNYLKINYRASNNKLINVSKKVNLFEEIGTTSFTDPASGENLFITDEMIFKHWLNDYDFKNNFDKLSRKITNGYIPSFAFTALSLDVKGGGATVLLKFAEWINKKGYKVTIYSDSKPPDWKELNVKIISTNNIKERYSSIKEDVVIIYSINELPLLFRLCDCNSNLVFHLCQGVETFHYSNNSVETLRNEKPFYKLLHSLPIGRITVSDSVNNYFKNKFNQNTFLIRNGIADIFLKQTIVPKEFRNNEIKLMFVGNPAHYLKGFNILVEALKKILITNNKYHFVVTILDGGAEVIETTEKNEFAVFTHKRCLSAKCMINEYVSADIYVNASMYEGFGLPTLEAMACGTPVIQCNNDGLTDIVKDGENCLMFNPGNSQELAEKIMLMISEPDLREKLIVNAKRLTEDFSELAQQVSFDREFNRFINLLENYSGNEKKVDSHPSVAELLKIKNKVNANKESPIDIILLTHNRLKYFFETISTLIKNTRYPYKLIIVDNDSDEKFKTYLKQSEILYDKIIYNDKNEWTPAFQKGIDISQSDPFIISDPDILVPNMQGKCWLERIVDLHKQNPEMGLIALNLDASNKPNKLEDVYLGDKEDYNNEIVLSNVGTVMQAIKRKYFNFPYVTDWETCERIRRNGGKVGFAKNIVAYHLGWDEDKDYPEYLVEKYKFFKKTFKVDTYKKYTDNKELLKEMDENSNQYYKFSRPEVQKLVDLKAKKILDVGCGEGEMASELKKRNNAEVWGIEIFDKAAEKAKSKLDKVLVGEVENKISQLPDEYFDTIIFADVLEHLVNPDRILKQIRAKLKRNGEVIVSIPNVRNWSVIKSLLDGSFDYEEAGILDKTHLKFYTLDSAAKMLIESGFKIDNVEATVLQKYNIPQSLLDELSKIGLDVSTLRERSQHYQYLFKLKKDKNLLVSIIIPVYNQLESTIETIESIYNFTEEYFELILIDNGSEKEISDKLKQLTKGKNNISIITNTDNLGFPKAINQGLRKAQGEYLVIANNDIVVTNGWLKKLIAHAESNKNIGIVGPVSNKVSGVQLLKEANYQSIEEMHEFAEEVSREHSGRYFEFPRVAFLCTLIKREVIEKIGGLDEQFSPGNYEDDDYCLRAQLAGFKTVIAQDVFVHHYGSKSFTAEGNEKYGRLLEKNKKKFINKWGVTPDEVWLEGKLPKQNNLFISLNNDFIQHVKNANEAIAKQDYNSALQSIDNAINNYDNKYNISLESLLLLGAKVAKITDDNNMSENYLKQLLQLSPDNNEALTLITNIYEQKDDFKSAIFYYENALKINFSEELKMKLNELKNKLNQKQIAEGQ